MYYQKHRDQNGKTTHCTVSLQSTQLLFNSLLNKGSAFPAEERETFQLQGFLPVDIETLDEQCTRSYQAFQSQDSDLAKHIYLRSLQDSNETLFYALLNRHLEEMLPVVYTPVVGLGCQQFSHIYRRPRGLFLTPNLINDLDKIFSQACFDNVTAIVVSDGERILGLGDQGAGGMGIPIGKLSLYTACAGIDPANTLPILLDTGTNNPERQKDPLYIGWRHERVRGADYDNFVDRFVAAVKKRFPHVLLQWEDFAQQNAHRLLDRYRNDLCTFNDDIQGTAAVAAGTLLSAAITAGISFKDLRIGVVGAGSAGCGISDLIAQMMINEGISKNEAYAHFYLIDQSGLLTADTKNLIDFQRPFAQQRANLTGWQLADQNKITLNDVVANAKLNVLIGVCGQPGVFTKEIVQTMAKHTDRPIIFPLSNPTSRAEATPGDLMAWTNEKAIIGTGSPFSPVKKNGKDFAVDQTNNAYIFPGMGLGLIASQASRVTDRMFMVAAQALAACSPAKQNPEANLLPPLKDIRQVSVRIAEAVAKEAVTAGLSPFKEQDLSARIQQTIWIPEYVRYQLV